MAGGTGGHVYPALAVAEYLREHGVQLFWLGTASGLEARVVPQHRIELFTVNIAGLRGKGLLRWLFSPVILCIALAQSLKILLRLKPSAVLGLGGFASGPGGLAAWLLRVPLLIHEQNAVAGLTNRLLAPFARVIMQGFPDAFREGRAITTGNPVRKDILRLMHLERKPAAASRPLRLLVLGGSLGARMLNEILPQMLRALPDDMQIDIWHQTGREHLSFTQHLYAGRLREKVKVVAYIEDMAEAYEWADLVICRAGALTISEISICGLPSLLVPYPYAVDDHQTANARYLCETGGAILLPQADLNVTTMVELLCKFDKGRAQLEEMGNRARQRAFPNATVDISRICMGVPV